MGPILNHKYMGNCDGPDGKDLGDESLDAESPTVSPRVEGNEADAPEVEESVEIVEGDNINNARRVIYSKRFLEMTERVRPHVRNDLVSFAIEMQMQGFPEERFWSVLEEVVEKNGGQYPNLTVFELSKYLVPFIMEKAGIDPEDKSEESRRKAIEYLIYEVWNKGHFYLPVNSTTASEIKESGILPLHIGTISPEDLEKFRKILKGKGLGVLLASEKNETELYDSALRTASPAAFHPEWLYGMTGGTAYMERSVGDVHSAIRRFAENDPEDEGSPHWEVEEQVFVMELLNKTWKKYGNTRPALVVVPRLRKLPNLDGKLDFFRGYDDCVQLYKKMFDESVHRPNFDDTSAGDLVSVAYNDFIGDSSTCMDRDIRCDDCEIIELPIMREKENDGLKITIVKTKTAVKGN